MSNKAKGFLMINEIDIRPFMTKDEEAILRLNENSVSVLSPMNKERFGHLHSMARIIWVAEKNEVIVGFLMGFSDGKAYDSPNYRWFDARLKNFFYIDRIVVSQEARSIGIGQAFYAKVQQWAKENGLSWLAAEIDIKPPNQGSLKFHEKHNFLEIARQTTCNGRKTVSLQIKAISG